MAPKTPIVPPIFSFPNKLLARAYEGFYIKVIDNVFSAEECAALIALAESDAQWEPAAVNYGLKPQESYVDTSYRNSERILRFDKAAADQIFERLLPLIPEVVEIKPGTKWATVVAPEGRIRGTWKLLGYILVAPISHPCRVDEVLCMFQGKRTAELSALWPRPLFQGTL